ncbi:hypothetical protein DL96DRAFT_1574460 [Flagelloscypha sp. PMI_526]|nr:hypothetical protein DL96DRAFT_1574460 [Flagelloscypha sp. PMI_526]
MSDAYDFRPGGSLKLKSKTVADGGVVKKKKKKSKKQDNVRGSPDRQLVKDLLFAEDTASGSPSGGRGSPAGSSPADRKTDAERRFEETQRKRLAQKVAKLAGKSHKDRVSEFNNHLESLSEHHDIPKVGPG